MEVHRALEKRQCSVRGNEN